jgi:acyl-CoA thioester hydrolase
MLPVTHLEMRYLRPALYDENIKVTTRLQKVPDKHIVFQVELHNERGKLLNAGRVKLAFVDKNTGKSIEAPEWIKALVKSAFDRNSLQT